MRKILHTRELLQNLAPQFVRGKTLDLGAGTAKYNEILRKYSSEYITCDAIRGPHIDYVEDAHNLSFENASFDTLILTMVLEHVDRPWIVASEVQRILKKGGRCIITVPFIFPYHADPEDYYRYSIVGLKSLFNECTTVKEGAYGGLFSILESFMRICICSPYKKNHPLWRRWLYQGSRIILEKLDTIIPSPKALYANSYVVVEKK